MEVEESIRCTYVHHHYLSTFGVRQTESLAKCLLYGGVQEYTLKAMSYEF